MGDTGAESGEGPCVNLSGSFRFHRHGPVQVGSYRQDALDPGGRTQDPPRHQLALRIGGGRAGYDYPEPRESHELHRDSRLGPAQRIAGQEPDTKGVEHDGREGARVHHGDGLVAHGLEDDRGYVRNHGRYPLGSRDAVTQAPLIPGHPGGIRGCGIELHLAPTRQDLPGYLPIRHGIPDLIQDPDPEGVPKDAPRPMGLVVPRVDAQAVGLLQDLDIDGVPPQPRLCPNGGLAVPHGLHQPCLVHRGDGGVPGDPEDGGVGHGLPVLVDHRCRKAGRIAQGLKGEGRGGQLDGSHQRRIGIRFDGIAAVAAAGEGGEGQQDQEGGGREARIQKVANRKHRQGPRWG